MHFENPPVGSGGTPAAAEVSMNYTFFHWGLRPWAIYIVLGLALGYFGFRRGLPLKPASAFYPLIGDRIYGPVGHLIDVLAVFGTLFGLATSIGLGASQIAAGLSDLFGIPNHLVTQLSVIGAVEVVAITSMMLGVDAGIRRPVRDQHVARHRAGGVRVLRGADTLPVEHARLGHRLLCSASGLYQPEHFHQQ